MDLFGIGAIAQGAASIAQAGINYRANQETNQANIDMNAANNAQNMAITEQNWARDDNSVQRRVADLRAAGLNPVLAAGQGAGNSAPIAMQPGRISAPQMQGLDSALGKSAQTYQALVQAKEMKDQQAAQTETMEFLRNKTEQDWHKSEHEAAVAAATADRMRHDNDWYKANRLPTNATGAVKDIAEMRSLIKEKLLQAEEKGVHVQGFLDLLGGY